MKKVLMIPLLASLLAISSANAETNNSAGAYNPFEEMRKMQLDMDRMFQRFQESMMKEDAFSSFPSTFPSSPAIDLKDNGDNYLLKADIPGAEKSEINITAKDGLLTIEAKSRKEESEKKEGFLKRERYEGVYIRSVSLPEDADADKLKSDYKDGVVTVTIPKKIGKK